MYEISNTVLNSASDSALFFSELLRLCGSNQLICCGVDRANRDNDGYTLLFNSSLAAKEAADVLRGDWDSVNATTVRQYDVVTIREDDSIVVEYAGESVKLNSSKEIEFCQQGQYCFVNQLLTDKARNSKSIIVTEKIMKAIGGELKRVPVFPTQSAD